MVGPAGSLSSFDEACVQVVGYLRKWVPLAFWSVSRFDGERQVYHYVEDDAYGNVTGGSHAWSDSFCQYMVAGVTPQIAPDAMAVPEYARAGIAQVIPIGAYAAVPVHRTDGSLFGTLCGLDPQAKDDGLLEHAPLLHLMATLLGRTLQAERMDTDATANAAVQRWASLHDPLTGLPNRAMFVDLVARRLRDTRGALSRPAVVLIDLDDFTAVNDTFGRAVGDVVLTDVADRLSAASAPHDVVACLGGDAFAVLVDDVGDAEAVASLVERGLTGRFTVAGTSVPVSASVGVASLPADVPPDVDEGLVVEAALAHADIARHTARYADRNATRTGIRNRYATYDPGMSLSATRDLKLREPLREAIRSGSVEAVYQPIVELDSGRVIAFEALARWTHDGVPVPPDVFVAIADRGGLLPELTDHMLDLAGSQLAHWSRSLGHQRLQVGVNVPPSLLVDPSFPDRVERRVRRHGLGPRQLTLEITEDGLLADPATAQKGARRLYEIGATLSMDDFGTGYSSLLHLQQIPLHSVKIDRGFASDLEVNPATRRFLRAVLALGRDLGLRVVVEGIERSTQAEALHRMFGTHAQGYYFGRPAAAEDIDVRPDS